ncbi:hypothetical protein BV898_00299 [Hypsibius exemplaris]|uniref:G-protein coupled receptors family 1 profile domain-containing protein n=1 Tax=Hypsibius exemplaris TaxID=2072580 RepID=A0A1W0XFB6_HYPEX|nr:hypothetical protein BV898_00299 [Hypsibius exemplaris]
MDNSDAFLNESSGNSTAMSHGTVSIFTAVIVLVTACLGVLTNALLFAVTITYRPIHGLASWPLLAHCMLVDCLVSATRLTMAIPLYLYPGYVLPDVYCQFQPLFSYLPYVASMYASTVLAIYRLVARMLPHRFAILTTRPVLGIALIIPWIVAIGLNLFPIFGVGLQLKRSSALGFCVMVSSLEVPEGGALIAYSTTATYAPTCVMGLCYGIVLTTTIRDVRGQRRQSMTSRGQAVGRRLEISKTLFLSYAWQCVSLYPLVIVASCFPAVFAESQKLQLLLRLLSNSYTTINPIFYWASSRLYADGTRSALTIRPRRDAKLASNSVVPLWTLGKWQAIPMPR